MARELVDESRAEIKIQPADKARRLADLGRTLLAQKKWLEAELVLRECLTIYESAQPDSWQTFASKMELGESLLGQGKSSAAKPLLTAGWEGMMIREQQVPGLARLGPRRRVDRIIELYRTSDDLEAVNAWKAKRDAFENASGPVEKQ